MILHLIRANLAHKTQRMINKKVNASINVNKERILIGKLASVKVFALNH